MTDSEDVPFSFSGGEEPYNAVTGEIVAATPVAMARQQNQPAALARGAASAIAMAAREQAMVRARIELARAAPRSLEMMRTKLIEECKRPGFAEAAIYSKPVAGKNMEGLSIRFAEAAARLMGNVRTEAGVVEEDDRTLLLRVTVIDLETNASWDDEVRINKTVERQTVKDGQIALSSRKNTQGKTVHLVVASEDELANKKASAVSKMARNLILRLLPGDIADECERQCRLTMQQRDAKDPRAALRALVDAFAAVGVLPDQLGRWLGHSVDANVSPAEVVELRTAYTAIKSGEARWADLLENHLLGAKKPAAAATPAAGAPAAPAAEAPAEAAPTPPPQEDPTDSIIAEFRKWSGSDAASNKGLAEWVAKAATLPGPGQERFGKVYAEVKKMLKEAAKNG